MIEGHDKTHELAELLGRESPRTLPAFLTVDELAAVLRCQPEKVYRLAARGELPSYKVEGRRLFAEAEVLSWLETQRDGSSPRANGRR